MRNIRLFTSFDETVFAEIEINENSPIPRIGEQVFLIEESYRVKDISYSYKWIEETTTDYGVTKDIYTNENCTIDLLVELIEDYGDND